MSRARVASRVGANVILKRIVKSAPAAALGSLLIGAYVRLVAVTSRIEIIGLERLRALEEDSPRGFIVAFWHARLLMAPTVRDRVQRRFKMLVSTHRDGQIVANAMRGFGIDFIAGSAANARKAEKDKNGAPAIAQMIGAIENGVAVGMTPDGPRGPARRAKIGVVKLAQMTGAKVLPIAYAASRARTLQTWDEFVLPLPFSKLVFCIGPAVDCGPQGAPASAARDAIEAGLNAVADEAERLARPVEAVASQEIGASVARPGE